MHTTKQWRQQGLEMFRYYIYISFIIINDFLQLHYKNNDDDDEEWTPSLTITITKAGMNEQGWRRTASQVPHR